MTDDPTIDVEKLADELKVRAERERASGSYAEADELAAQGLVQTGGLDSDEPRIRFRPELGFSAKPIVGPVLTGVKKLNLRLLAYVLDDIARQADAAVRRLEAALSYETATREAAIERTTMALQAETDAREALEREVRALSERVAALEKRT